MSGAKYIVTSHRPIEVSERRPNFPLILRLNEIWRNWSPAVAAGALAAVLVWNREWAYALLGAVQAAIAP